jgi:WD40 repeat protein
MAENFANAKVLFTLPWNSDVVTTVAFLDNRTVAAGNKRGDILVWTLPAAGEKSPNPVRKLEGHTNEINRMLVSPDGTLLISVSSDRLVKYWDAKSTTGEPGQVTLNDGFVRAGVTEKVPKLPTLPKPITVNVFVQKSLRELKSHKDWVWGLALTRDGKTLFTGDDAGVVIVSETHSRSG